MKKNITLLIITFITFISISDLVAQGHELKFNRVLIVDNNQVSVPAGTIWKVTSIFGEEFDACITVKYGSAQYYTKTVVSFMYVNGVQIPSSIRGLGSNSTMYGASNCTNTLSGGYDLSGSNKSSDPNVFPLWLPENATIRSGGPSTFVSVMEFIVL